MHQNQFGFQDLTNLTDAGLFEENEYIQIFCNRVEPMLHTRPDKEDCSRLYGPFFITDTTHRPPPENMIRFIAGMRCLKISDAHFQNI